MPKNPIKVFLTALCCSVKMLFRGCFTDLRESDSLCMNFVWTSTWPHTVHTSRLQGEDISEGNEIKAHMRVFVLALEVFFNYLDAKLQMKLKLN